jgi:hypothetical protein
LILASLAILVSGCGPAAPITGSFVAEFSNGAAYLAWTRTGNTLVGNFSQAFRLEGRTALTHESFSVTGTAEGNGISLKLDVGFGLGPTAVGTFRGDQLTLTFPSGIEGLSVYHFRPGTESEYMALVAAVQARIDEARAVLEAKEAEAQRQAARDRAVTKAASALKTTLDRANHEVNRYAWAVEGMEGALGNVSDAYETMIDEYTNTFVPDAAVRPMDAYQQSTVARNLSLLDYRRALVTYHLDTVRSNFSGEASAARNDARSYLASVEERVRTLEVAMAANPGFAPAIVPASARAMRDQLAAQIAALDERRATALSKAKDFEDMANALYAKAEETAMALGAM